MPLGKLDPNRYLSLPAPGEGYLLVIPDAGRHLLMTLIEAATWRGKYSPDPNDAEWDSIGEIVGATMAGLMEAEKVTLIEAAINGVEAAIRETSCCGTVTPITDGYNGSPNPGGGGTIAPLGEPADIPADTTTTLEGDPNTGTYDHIDLDSNGTIGVDEWDAYMCRAAAWLFDSTVDLMRFMRFSRWLFIRAIDVLQWLVSRIVSVMVAGPADDAVLMALDQLYDMESALTEDISYTLWTTAIAEMEAVRDETICCMKDAVGSAAMAQCLLDAFTANVSSNLVLTFLTSGPWFAVASLLWNGLFDVPDEVCDCLPDDQLVKWSRSSLGDAYYADALLGTYTRIQLAGDCNLASAYMMPAGVWYVKGDGAGHLRMNSNCAGNVHGTVSLAAGSLGVAKAIYLDGSIVSTSLPYTGWFDSLYYEGGGGSMRLKLEIDDIQ